MIEYILKVDSRDEKGLIYRITDIILKHGLNIHSSSEFVDHENNRFFFRSVIKTEKEVNEDAFVGNLSGVLPSAKIEFGKKRKKDIVILATKEIHCLGDLLIRHYDGKLNANIKAVIANHDILSQLVEKFDVAFHHINAEGLSREEHEKRVLDKMSEYSFDYVILAKYMRILSPNFVNNYEGRIINIHHSFLPAFIGANPYKQAYERGVKIIGATAHFVNNNLDEGPIIVQDVTSVNHEMRWQDMRDAGRYAEKSVLLKAVDLVLDDRVFVYDNKTVIF
ncbi:MAG: formyltetrahydrofolate deformylase [Campylobacter sp.]|nr:formyltetrahydrofolate deformylase [Campylobacter sp.]